VVLAAVVLVIPGLAGFFFPRWTTPACVVVAWCAVIGTYLVASDPEDYADLSTVGVAWLGVLFYVLPAAVAAILGMLTARLWRHRPGTDDTARSC
jgi:hypothetical protein